jgi:hypothetical protein
MANTIADRVYRDKYRMAKLDALLRRALVVEAICDVDRTDNKRIQSPYGSTPTAVVQAIAGTYSVAEYQTTDDTLIVTDEVIVAEHIFDFEEVLTAFNVFSSRVDEQGFAVANRIDRFVLNNITEDATGSYSTPAGGFATAANIPVIMSNIIGKVAGFADAYKGLFIVIENTEVPGFIQSQASSGFSFADAALKNGFMTSYMGVDIYVTRTGTFASETLGTTTYTNSGHRLAGVKGVATYASPRGVRFEEKAVSGKTGMEVVTYGYVGAKVWAPKSDLLIDITIVAS